MADWYAGWVGVEGSEHHRRVVIPTLLELLDPRHGESVLDVGCGPGVLAPHIAARGASYTGVDAGARMIAFARRHHGASGRFIVGDATRLADIPQLDAARFDAVVFALSIQDIDPLEAAIEHACCALRRGGRLVLFMTHPCFRVPRQSGWGWDAERRLQFRRVDHYLTPLVVPMKRHGMEGRYATRSHHRPLERYVNALARAGVLIDAMREIATHRQPSPGARAKAERRANAEIPLFLAVRGVKR